MACRCFLARIAVCALLAATTCAFAQPPAGIMADLARPQSYQALRESSARKDLTKNMDRDPIEPGATTVLGELEGPGAITHLWCFANTPDPFFGRGLVLRIYWDGAENPSVEAPLGDFFAVGHGANVDVDSFVVSATSFGRSRNCFWHMPFLKSARVTITNESDIRTNGLWYLLNWRKYDSLPEDAPYFHARYRQEFPAQPGDYEIADLHGKGHYVGTVLSVHETDLGWFGEGDERFYVDGEEYPSLSGTGTEEYFGDAWGMRSYCRPFFGVTLFDGYYAGDRVSAYRWHIADPIPFRESLRMTIEHRGGLSTDDLEWLGGFFERPDWFSSVAFWYQSPAVGFAERIPPWRERLAPYRILERDALEIAATPEVSPDEDGLFNPCAPDASIRFAFAVEEAGHYQVNAVMGHFFPSGVYQPYVDDEAVGGPRDYCFSGEDTAMECFDVHELAAGKHVLRFEGRGLSPRHRPQVPKRYSLRLDKLVLLRLEDMAGYHEARRKALEEREAK